MSNLREIIPFDNDWRFWLGDDLTEYLKMDGSSNILAVRIDDSAEPSVRWYAGSGIYRHVRLITIGEIRISASAPGLSSAILQVK